MVSKLIKMRKLYILRAIVNYLWIISMIAIPVLAISIPGIFFIEKLDLDFNLNGNTVKIIDIPTKIFFVIYAIAYLFFIYVIYLFKKIIRDFLRTKVFSDLVIKNLHKIGLILTIVGLVLIITSFFYRLNNREFQIDLGIGNNIITICFGLFFMVLSEIFKISKNLKQENDLTI